MPNQFSVITGSSQKSTRAETDFDFEFSKTKQGTFIETDRNINLNGTRRSPKALAQLAQQLCTPSNEGIHFIFVTENATLNIIREHTTIRKIRRRFTLQLDPKTLKCGKSNSHENKATA